MIASEVLPVPSSDTSLYGTPNWLALEMLGFTGPDVREGLASLRERRKPKFGQQA